jgi:hypothetical protein
MGAQQDRPADVYSDFMSAEDVDAMCRVLKKQRDGLQHLTDILTYVHLTCNQYRSTPSPFNSIARMCYLS